MTEKLSILGAKHNTNSSLLYIFSELQGGSSAPHSRLAAAWQSSNSATPTLAHTSFFGPTPATSTLISSVKENHLTTLISKESRKVQFYHVPRRPWARNIWWSTIRIIKPASKQQFWICPLDGDMEPSISLGGQLYKSRICILQFPQPLR